MDIIIGKLKLRAALTDAETQALKATFSGRRTVEPRQDLLVEGEPPAFVGALMSGMLCRYKSSASGERQILSFPIAGDIFDLHSFLVARMDHSIGAISRAHVATATHAAVQQLSEAHPRVGAMLWRDAVVEAAVFREWIVNCGRRSAYARAAHLFCELYTRMSEVGLGGDRSCDLPLTQADLSHALGLSTVHVNRVLQALRADGLIALRLGRLEVLDWDGLVEAGGFEADYLHTGEPPAPAPRIVLPMASERL